MKTAIITLHYAHNYGAVLQAWALKHALEGMGHEVQFVNYKGTRDAARYLRPTPNFVGRREIVKPGGLKRYLEGRRDAQYAQPAWVVRQQAFEAFIREKLLGGDPPAVTLEDLPRMEVDAFVCGSDQVWSNKITDGPNPVYYMAFETKARRVAYAASMGPVVCDEAQTERIRGWLEAFDAIAVREQDLGRWIAGLLPGREAPTVVSDPTLLLNSADYAPLLQDIPEPAGSYVLAYFTEDDSRSMPMAKALAAAKGKPLIAIRERLRRSDDGADFVQTAQATPGQFLTYIKNADCMITDSFHGTVFSVLNHKEFYTIDPTGTNNRAGTLLAELGIPERKHRTDEALRTDPVDWAKVDANLQGYRERSMGYLQRALG